MPANKALFPPRMPHITRHHHHHDHHQPTSNQTIRNQEPQVHLQEWTRATERTIAAVSTPKGSAPVGFGAGGSITATNVGGPTMGELSVPTPTKPPPPSEEARPINRDPKFLRSPLPLGIVNNHVDINTLAFYLRGHPDPQLVNYVLTGLRHGFDLGFNGNLTPVARNNNKSARENPTEVTKAIIKELSRGHTAGPFPSPPFPVNHISPLGAAPKPDGSCRLVLDLSQPEGLSVNDNIDKLEFPTVYTHFDKATDMIRRLGKGCLLSKIDIKHAYRILPVRMEDWPLLVYQWDNQYYVDLVLPFGGRSSSSIFTSFADLLCWILNQKQDLNAIHYSDDYLLASPPEPPMQAQSDLTTFKSTFKTLGVPIAEDKLVGPTTNLTFIGIAINTDDFLVSIPSEKIQEVVSQMPRWCSRRTCTQVELQSLVGKLQFFSKVIRPGRIFTRRLIDLIYTVRRPTHHVTLTKHAKEDIHWWCELLHSWNQASIIPATLRIYSTDIKLYTDAAKTIGFGAVLGNSWIQAAWPTAWLEVDINFKELFAIVAAAFTWGHEWRGRRIVFITDNKPITQIWAAGTTPVPSLMSLIRKLFIFAASNNILFSFKHILGHFNTAADALSRSQVSRFRQVMPDADENPTAIPETVWEIGSHTHTTH